MSSTEIYIFKKDGEAEFAFDVRNSFRGAMAIWKYLEEKYLPSLESLYGWPKDQYLSRTLSSAGGDMQEVWDLANNTEIPIHERICLATTFDMKAVRRKNLPDIIEAFDKFEGETHLKEQAEKIQELLDDDPDFIGIGWKQTSVNGDDWSNIGGQESCGTCGCSCEGEYLPYNILTMDRHDFVFTEDHVVGE